MKSFRFSSNNHLFFSLVLLFVLGAPLLAFHRDLAAPGGRLTVMTRNLYVGASFRPMLDISSTDEVPERAAQVYANILSSRFQGRAEALADEIVRARPDVLGLQEIPLLLVQSRGDVSVGNQDRPATVATDYLQILMNALGRRHAHYAIAAIVNNTDLSAPTTHGGTIRLIDRDAILVCTDVPRDDLRVLNAQVKNFERKATIELLGNDVTLLRSYCSVNLMVRGKEVRVINTHLEENFFDIVQFCQAQELLEGPFRVGVPVIALGDFNTSEKSDTYRYLLRTGVKDSWSIIHPEDPGFTCCQAEDLLNSKSQLNERIDLILYDGSRMNVNDVKLVGVLPDKRIPSGQWSSDHAGVVATFSIK
jgi:endonuclease/exonuclease/phosphatase family metal-dependent hydrolase